MLNIIFGHPDGEKLSGDGFFDVNVDEEVLLTDFGREVVKKVDKGDVRGKNLIVTEVLGPIPPHYLSGGTKVLLTLYSDWGNKVIFTLNAMGDDCLPFLADIADKKDITLATNDYRHIFNNSKLDKVYIKNYNKIANNDDEFWKLYEKFCIEDKYPKIQKELQALSW